MYSTDQKLEMATLGGGCFWCTEAVFRRLKGVESVTSGYAGDDIPNPTYEQVSSGNSGHTEAVQVNFDPAIIPFDKILEVFWAMHDPTTLNRQGNDVGEQYRSVIFFHSDEQKKIAEKSINDLEKSGKYHDEVVTAIEPYRNFYPAEEDHQKFYENNPNYGYCQLIIDPKIKKLYKDFSQNISSKYK